MTPFIVAQGNFNVPQNFLAHTADSGSEDSNGFRRVPVEDRKEILMLEPGFRVQSASGQQRVFQAHGGGFAKGCLYVKFIISFQIAAVNDAEYLHAVIQPVGMGKLIGNAVKLPFQPFRGRDIVADFQRACGSGFIALIHFPLVGCFGMLARAGIRNVEHIPQFGGIA
jgi:hypothetical protein